MKLNETHNNKESNKPQFLYRYTNVKNLEILLNRRTIRFNPLASMDDYQEQWSAHGNALGNFFFISCWVADEQEDIRMWKEYCRPNEEGVRIKLPVNPFSHTENNLLLPVPEERELMDSIRLKIIDTIHKCFPETKEDMFSDDFEGMIRMRPYKERLRIEFPKIAESLNKVSEEVQRKITKSDMLSVDNLLHKVEYTDDKRKIYPWIYQDVGSNMIGNFSYYGKYKSLKWAWQQEWRYILSFSRLRGFRKKVDGTIVWYPLPFDHYDLIVSPTALSNIEVTLSPLISDEAKERVKAIVPNCLMSKL